MLTKFVRQCPKCSDSKLCIDKCLVKTRLVEAYLYIKCKCMIGTNLWKYMGEYSENNHFNKLTLDYLCGWNKK